MPLYKLILENMTIHFGTSTLMYTFVSSSEILTLTNVKVIGSEEDPVEECTVYRNREVIFDRVHEIDV